MGYISVYTYIELSDDVATELQSYSYRRYDEQTTRHPSLPPSVFVLVLAEKG